MYLLVEFILLVCVPLWSLSAWINTSIASAVGGIDEEKPTLAVPDLGSTDSLTSRIEMLERAQAKTASEAEAG